MQLTLSRHVVVGTALALMSFSTFSSAEDKADVMNNVDLTYPAPGQSAPVIDSGSGLINEGNLTDVMPSRQKGHLIIDGKFRQRYATPKVESVDLQSETTVSPLDAPSAISAPAESDDVVTPPAAEGEPMGSVTPSAEIQGAAIGGTQANALLWKITGNDIAASYLFGTIHSDDPRVLDLPNELTHALAMADVFVPEADISGDAIAQLRANMLFDDGETLESIVGTELFSSVAARLARLGVSNRRASRIKPWAAIMMLASPPNESGDFLDKRLYEIAVRSGKAIAPLETLEEQLAVFTELSAPDQIALLENTVAAHGDLPKVVERLTRAWLSRDLSELQRITSTARLSADTAALANEFHQRLVEDRNSVMVERLLPMLGTQAHFVAVGALHLPGQSGLLTQLTDHGYTLTALY